MVKAYYHISPESKYRVQSGKIIMSSGPINFFKRYFLVWSWCLWANVLQCIVNTFFFVFRLENTQIHTSIHGIYVIEGNFQTKDVLPDGLFFFDECICLTSSTSSAHTTII